MSKTGDAIRAARQAAGMQSKDLALAVDLTPQAITNIEHGWSLPTTDRLFAICNQFPAEDSAAWLWLLLEDQWGTPIADVMRRHARVPEAEQ